MCILIFVCGNTDFFMPKTKQQKQHILQELVDHIAKQTSITFVDYKGVTVHSLSTLRSELKKLSAQLVVAKKTLLAKALTEKGIDINTASMEGQVAAIFAYADSVGVVKAAAAAMRTNEHLKFIAGYFEKQIQTKEQMEAIATLPPKDELLARFVGSIASPLSGFMNVLQGNIKGLAVVLQAIAQKNT